MLRTLPLIIFLLICTLSGFAQNDSTTTREKDTTGVNTRKPRTTGITTTTDDSDDSDNWATQFKALGAYTFTGNNKGLSNLTPVVHLGTEYELVSSDKFTWGLDMDPYIGSQIDTKDSMTLIPALMLWGNGGLLINNYLKFKINKVRLTIAPLNIGIKFLANFLDSGNLIIQHNIRMGVALEYDDKFMIGAQLTHGWHNSTSESERFYKGIFSSDNTSISYLLVLIQAKISEKLLGETEESKNNTYAFFEFRNLLSKEKYAAFTNNRILTVGLRKDLSLRNVFTAKAREQKRNNR